MLYDVCIRKELLKNDDARVNPAFTNVSNHRDGLECMNFLFDFINDVAGYTEKYYEETE